VERGFLCLIGIRDQATEEIDQEVRHTAMVGLFDLGKVFISASVAQVSDSQ
jgi:hypothetical protein